MSSRRVPVSWAGLRLLQRLEDAGGSGDARLMLGTSPAAWGTMQVLAQRWLVAVRGGRLAITRDGRALLHSRLGRSR
jgi:hypothetical protein